MVVELGFAAAAAGALVAIYHGVQILRPRFGHGSDVTGRRTPWIIGGMAVLTASGALAAVATAWMATAPVAGMALAAVAYFLIGVGGGAGGTALLALTAARVAPERRPAAAATLWLMMIMGFVITAGTAGTLLDPYSHARLVAVVSTVAATAFVVAVLAVRGLERGMAASVPPEGGERLSFKAALRQIWAEREARRFTLFVFVAMLAYSAQDLILEPFAGIAFAMTPGETTKLASLQYTGVLFGMITVAALGSRGLAPKGWMRRWTVAGCLASSVALAGLVAAAWWGPGWPVRGNVFLLGFTNGVFAVAAIGSMMTLAGTGMAGREGVRLGLWGAAQAIASALGGFLGTVAVDVIRFVSNSPTTAYASVFAMEAVLFVVAAAIAAAVTTPGEAAPRDIDARGRLAAPTAGG
jgi:BCD family chlorophyll transporter-like MFS transporter